MGTFLNFTRMNPDSTNMVTETTPMGAEKILCVECGWEYTNLNVNRAPWVVFKDHPCRLITESVSKGN